MGFTNVAWESRGTPRLAGDLTQGPGPAPVGQVGAAWVRVANELAEIADEFGKIIEQIGAAAEGGSADVVRRKLEDVGRWLQAVGIGAAENGEKTERAAVAQSVAVLAMPTVSEAVEAQTQRDIMASLSAYNSAVLNGHFAEFDQTASSHHETASAVMYQYEESCQHLAKPWDQTRLSEVLDGAGSRERSGASPDDPSADQGASAVAATAAAPLPLGAFRADGAAPTKQADAVRAAASAATTSGAGSGWGGMGAGYGAMGAGLARADGGKSYESSLASDALAGAGEPGAGISDGGGSWLPTAQQNDVPVLVSNVSWGPNTAVFDQLLAPDEPPPPQFADEPEQTMDKVSDRWVSPAVIGHDRRLTL